MHAYPLHALSDLSSRSFENGGMYRSSTHPSRVDSCCDENTSSLVLLLFSPPPKPIPMKHTRKLLGEAARVLSTGGKYMLFSAFGNDGLGHKDMADMLSHPGFGGEVQVPPHLLFCYLFRVARSRPVIARNRGRVIAKHRSWL